MITKSGRKHHSAWVDVNLIQDIKNYLGSDGGNISFKVTGESFIVIPFSEIESVFIESKNK